MIQILKIIKGNKVLIITGKSKSLDRTTILLAVKKICLSTFVSQFKSLKKGMSLNSKLHFTGTQGKGYMPDGTSRMTKDGKEIFHFMGCSTFAEYAVIAEISAAKIHPGADLYQMCLLGCGLVLSTPSGFLTNSILE